MQSSTPGLGIHEKNKIKGKIKAKTPPAAHEGGKGLPGYTYGSQEVDQSPLTLQELELLKETVLWTDEDAKYMRMSREVLEDQTDDILDVWFSFMKVMPHLAVYFSHGSDQATLNKDYMEAVRLRFKQWILDTTEANFDQDWLNYQYEIGLRHHWTKKNKTDHVDSVSLVNLRYMIVLIYPITATLKPFLAKKHDHDAEDVECMYHAWLKSVILQVCLWSQPYVKDGEF